MQPFPGETGVSLPCVGVRSLQQYGCKMTDCTWWNCYSITLHANACFLTERPGGCWDIGAFIPFVCKTARDHLFRLNNSQTTVISVLHSCSCLCTYMHVCVKFGVCKFWSCVRTIHIQRIHTPAHTAALGLWPWHFCLLCMLVCMQCVYLQHV